MQNGLTHLWMVRFKTLMPGVGMRHENRPRVFFSIFSDLHSRGNKRLPAQQCPQGGEGTRSWSNRRRTGPEPGVFGGKVAPPLKTLASGSQKEAASKQGNLAKDPIPYPPTTRAGLELPGIPPAAAQTHRTPDLSTARPPLPPPEVGTILRLKKLLFTPGVHAMCTEHKTK